MASLFEAILIVAVNHSEDNPSNTSEFVLCIVEVPMRLSHSLVPFKKASMPLVGRAGDAASSTSLCGGGTCTKESHSFLSSVYQRSCYLLTCQKAIKYVFVTIGIMLM